ncbi:hypothetical protein [Deinococcus koreensis]|uniref:Uncharacterized protein n=1 Tax=Deinococcus koreensis TaxID=2054903 RepID=A0A2K3V0Q4_9DEIO|nr:hypothetical protein [Deinococcus koreensis]PNY82367.1 hypothetical protein CVO96_14260 [Deinococcus koreensis]
MLRVAFILTALIFIPTGLYLYFLPPTVAALAGVAPLWLARVAGGVLLAWGVATLLGSARPDGLRTGALVGGNLLTVAALLPAVVAGGASLAPGLRTALTVLILLLGALALTAILAYPSRRSRL